ncbi:MAG: hypothetical protein JW891_00845 [Candidatus Lokiarchaeota archaeon]|nr:hypothetical protein [Candidatus Lokiarchaeota archaeon]
MGWKASVIFVYDTNAGPIKEDSPHDRKAAQDIISKLQIGDHYQAELSCFDEGIYPRDDELFIGCYPQGYIICHDTLSNAGVEGKQEFNKVVDIFPNSEILVLILHSVVNLFGYAYYKDGRRIRARAGSANDGVFIEEGNPLPEEDLLFAKSKVIDGQRIWEKQIHGQMETFSEDAMGETFVFELSKRVFGTRIDDSDVLDLEMDKFLLKKP